MNDHELMNKYGKMQEYLRAMENAAVAFSGGVDSAFLLYAAKEALGGNVIAVTASSYLFPQREENEALDFCRKYDVRQVVVPAKQLEIPGFADNPPERCYLCKKELFGSLIKTAADQGFGTVLEGSNTDDMGDYRPGRRAVLELGVKSPLLECGFSKKEIRLLSEKFGLPTWSKPSFACLASRFPYGETITEEKLRMIDAAEQFLLDLKFTQLRVRLHAGAGGDIARIELPPEDFERFMTEEVRLKVSESFRRLGFAYSALDLKGYRTGSMNEIL